MRASIAPLGPQPPNPHEAIRPDTVGLTSLPVDSLGADREAKHQLAEDEAVLAALKSLHELLQLPDNFQFYLCSSPADVGISDEAMTNLEQRAYANSGYGQRSEGKDFLTHAYRGYDENERGALRFVLLAKTNEESKQVPVAFFNYFKVTRHLFPEFGPVTANFMSRKGFSEEPVKYVASKLVADHKRPRELRNTHQLALVSVFNSLASLEPQGLLIETQAQPATRRMAPKVRDRFLPTMEILLDQEIPTPDEGGYPSKMLVYLPNPNMVQAA